MKNIKVEITKDEIIIDGFELKPYWKRLVLVLCWWKNPKIILKNPKIFYRTKEGVLIDLEKVVAGG